MEPAVIRNRAAHRRDPELAAALKGARTMPISGKPVLIAFRNESGEMYRFALLQGPAQLRYLRLRLVQLRLLSKLEEEGGPLAVLGT